MNNSERSQIDPDGPLFDRRATCVVNQQKATNSIDNVDVCNNAGALSFQQVPPRLAVVGAGVIGLELGSVSRRLGSAVTVIEALPQLLPMCDVDVALGMHKLLTSQGLEMRFSARVSGLKREADGTLKLSYTDSSGAEQSLAYDKLVGAIGCVPTGAGLGSETIGVRCPRGLQSARDLHEPGSSLDQTH